MRAEYNSVFKKKGQFISHNTVYFHHLLDKTQNPSHRACEERYKVYTYCDKHDKRGNDIHNSSFKLHGLMAILSAPLLFILSRAS